MNRKTRPSGLRRAADVGNRIFSAMRRAHRLPTSLLALAGAVLAAAFSAYANPKGGQVSGGSAVITQTNPSRLDIVQSTDRAAIDWQSFSIAPNEQTNFQQPAATSMTLNRVAPGDPSVIAGRLTANGQIVLVNPSGITFSKGAVVDVNSIVATPTDISNANFMAGRMRFDKPSTDPRATIVNQGTITVAQKGLAALVGPAVANSGVIQAKLGKVVLAGAQTYTVDFYGDGLISFDVGPKVTTVPTGPDGQPVKSLVSHTGQIDAPGGTVLLTADAAAGIIGNVIDARGRITAQTNGPTPGSVTIDGGPGGGANLSGTIDVSGLNPGQKGGSATMTGGSVALAGTARIDARGDAGGGTVRIGGNFHGAGPQRNATTTYVAQGTIVSADAITSGNGGQVAVWSDQSTVFAGSITATGGSNTGDGGFAEISSHNVLQLTGTIDVSAPHGSPGTILLDPRDLTITVNGQNDADVGPGGVSVNSPNQNTDISVSASALTALSGNLLIEASRDLTVAASLNFTKQTAGEQVSFLAGRNLTVNSNVQITTASANLLLAAAVPNDGPPYTTNSEFNTFVNFSPTGALTINGSLDSGAGSISLVAGTINALPTGGVAINGSIKSTLAIDNPNGNVGVELISTGSITEAPLAVISVPALHGLTLNDKSASINLMSTNNQIGAVTLSTLTNSGQTAAAGPITLINGMGFQIFHVANSGPFNPGLAPLEFGINTAGDAFLSAVSSVALAPISTSAGTRIAAANLLVRTQADEGGEITLTNPNNAVPGNVTLSALNAAGTAPSTGAINFVDISGFTVAGVSTAATATLQAGGPLQQGGPIIAQNMVVRTQLDAGAPITLTNPGNAVPGNVTLSALNTAGTAPASGAITFVDSTGFTTTALPSNGLNGQEIGVNTTGSVSLQTSGPFTISGGAIETGSAMINISASSIQLNTNNLPCGNGFVGCDLKTTGDVTLIATTGDAGERFGIVDAANLSVSAPQGSVLFDGPITNGVLGSLSGVAGNTFQFVNCCTFSVAGVSTTAGDVRLRTTPLVPPGSPSNIILTGNLNAGAGKSNVALVASGDLTESGGSVTSSALILNAGGAVTFDGSNAVSTLAGASVGAFRFVNGNALTVGTVPQVVDVPLQSGVVTEAALRVRTNSGDLVLASGVVAGGCPSAVTTCDAQPPPQPAALVATAGSVRETTGSVSASGLIANTGGGVTLNNSNSVTAVSGTAGTSFELVNERALAVEILGPIFDVSRTSSGIVASAGNVKLATTSGSVNIFDDVTAMGGGVAIGVAAGGTFTNFANITSTGTGSAGNIVILADAISLNPPADAIVAGPSSAVVLGPFTAATPIDLAPVNSVGIEGHLRLTDGDLGTVTAGLLQIGYSGATGNITVVNVNSANVATPVTLNASQIPNLALVTAGGVSQSGLGTGINYSAGKIGIIAGNAVALTVANDNTVAGVVNNPTQDFQFTDSGSLTVGNLAVQQAGVSIEAATNFPVLSLTGTGSATNPVAGVTTAGGNIVLETTTTGNLVLNQLVNAGTGIVGLSSAGTVTQAPPIIASSLAILSAGGVSLGADLNQVGTLAAQVLNPGASFVFRNDSANLTIGTVALPPPLTLSVGPVSAGTLSGVITNGGNIILETTRAGNLALNQTVSAGAGLVGLASAGTITQSVTGGNNGVIVASELEILSKERVSLGAFVGPTDQGAPNQVATLAGQVLDLGESFVLRSNNAAGLTIGTVDVMDSSRTQRLLDPVTGVALTGPLVGVMTEDANVGLRMTSSSNLTLMQNVAAGRAGVGLESAGGIQQVSGVVTGNTLEIAAAGPVSLSEANRAAMLAGRVTGLGSANGVLFRDDGQDLTIGTVPTLLESATGIPPSSQMLSVTGLSGVTTNRGNILLETTTTGNLALSQPINANNGSLLLDPSSGGIGLSSAGTITQSASGVIVASQLGLRSQERVSLGAFVGPNDQSAPNQAATLAGQVIKPGESFVFRSNAPSLTIGTVTLPPPFGTLSGVMTTDANIGLRATGSMGLLLAANVSAGSGGIGLESAGQLQMAGPLSGTIEISSVGPVSLSASAPVTLSAQITGAGNSFQFVDHGATLTIGASDALREQGTGTPPNNQMLTIGGLVGVSTNNGNILLETTTSGNLVLNQAVSAGTGSVTLNSAGIITEQSRGTITTAGTLSGSSVGGASMTQPNQVGTFGSFDNTTGGLLAFTDAQPLATAGMVSSAGGVTLTTTGAGSNLTLGGNLTASGQTVMLNSAGTISEQSGGTITAGTLNGSSVGGASLTQANLVGTFGPFNNAASGLLSFTNAKSLTTGALSSAGDATLTTIGAGSNLTLGGNLAAPGQSVTLSSAGTITQNAPITAQNLVARTQSDAGAALTLTDPANTVPGNVTLSALNSAGTAPAPGTIDFVDSTGFTVAAQPANGLHGQEIGVNTTADVTLQAGGDFLLTGGGSSTLTVGGMISSGAGVIALAAGTGGISISGSIARAGSTASTSTGLGLFSTGPVIESATGTISVPYLLALTENDAGAPITLTGAGNSVDAVTLSTLSGPRNPAGPIAAPGKISFADSKGFQILPVIGIENFNRDLMVLRLTPAQVSALTPQLFGINTTADVNLMTLNSGSNLTLAGNLSAPGHMVTLNSSGTITEQPDATITAGTLTGSSAGGASLTQANQVATFGPFTNTTSGLLSFTDAQRLTTAGAVSSAGGLTLTTTGGSNLTLGGNLTASGQVTLTSAGSITEVNDPVITAPDLNVGAAGKVSLGLDGGTVFPANANMVGTLTGKAGGSFGFLNGTALTVGTITASAGDVLIQVNNADQPLTLAGNINVTAGGRVILDTAGGFSQTGTATVNAPVLAIDTTGSGVNTLLGFITSPSVNASVVSNLPPAGKTSNQIHFENLSAPNSVVLLFADQGSVSGPIQAGQLGLSGTGSLADLQGSINGVSGPTAALLGVRAPGPNPTYLFNECIIAAPTCVVISPNQPLVFLVTQPQTASEIQALSVSPNLSAQFVLIEPEIVKGVRQSENPDAPVINIFDEERLCDETAKSGPTKEPCREER